VFELLYEELDMRNWCGGIRQMSDILALFEHIGAVAQLKGSFDTLHADLARIGWLLKYRLSDVLIGDGAYELL